MNLRKKWDDYRINRVISCLWFIIITFLTLSPGVQTPSIVIFQDKLEHMAAFAILAILLCRSFNPDKKYGPIDRVLISIFIVTLYGAVDESIQGFMPDREASVFDLTADIFGALLGGVSFLFIPFLNNME